MRVFVALLVLCCLAQAALAKLIVSNSAPVQGETIEVTWEFAGSVGGFRASQSQPIASIAFNGHDYQLFPDQSGSGRCLIAIPADLVPGKYKLGPITVPSDSFGDKPVSTEAAEILLTIKDAKFPVQHLTLPKTKNNFNTSPGEQKAMDAVKATLSDARLWEGKFTKPCQARISAGFGIRRVVNGKLLKDYYHSGIDFAGNLGQPVQACADGKVILAHRNFKLHGNVIALDHGQGVVTIYVHLQKIMVKEGDMVKAGQQIGAVGATGRANGPHLHLSLYVNQVAANPMPWFTKTF